MRTVGVYHVWEDNHECNMPLICRTCGAVNHDPGGDPLCYRCGHCGNPTLFREQTTDKRIATAIAGAAVIGMATGNPIGALVGGVLGFWLGANLHK